MTSRNIQTRALSALEHRVLEALWARGEATAEQVREALPGALKESTVRTLLRRLEAKGYAAHRVEGRTYVYRGLQAPAEAAGSAVRGLVEKFCGGSVEQLLVGMVDAEVLSARELSEIAARIAKVKGRKEQR